MTGQPVSDRTEVVSRLLVEAARGKGMSWFDRLTTPRDERIAVVLAALIEQTRRDLLAAIRDAQ